MTVETIPSFSRVEITIRGRDDLAVAATELRLLAGDLDFISGQNFSNDEAMILAHHKIRAASKKLRGSNGKD